MNKLFGLFLLALAFLAPDVSQAASRFAVCATTCTWDNSSTAMWSASSGGATGASAPVAGDDVTLDGATCVGGTTCTITTFSGTIAFANLTQSACTASTAGCILEASTNSTNFTISGAYTNTGAGTRTLNASGTWTFTGAGVFWNVNSSGTYNMGSSTIALTGNTTTTKTFAGGGKTYGTLSYGANTSRGILAIQGANTFATVSLAAGSNLQFPTSTTITITNAFTWTGTSASPISIYPDNPSSGGVPAISVSTGTSTCTWCVIYENNATGGGTFSAANSLDLGRNAGSWVGNITAPSVGGSTPKTIGG